MMCYKNSRLKINTEKILSFPFHWEEKPYFEEFVDAFRENLTAWELIEDNWRDWEFIEKSLSFEKMADEFISTADYFV